MWAAEGRPFCGALLAGKQKIVILGAGVGGLAAGYFLARTGKYEVTVLEKEAVIGGLCASFEHDGFVLDYGAHKLYSVIPGILDEINALMGPRLLRLPKKNRLFIDSHLLDYPLRLTNLATSMGFTRFFGLGLGYGLQLIKSAFDRRAPHTYEEFIVGRFGRPTYELVFKPLAEKVWGDPSSLHPEMARTRLPASGGMEVALKLLGLKKESAETNAEFFYYPRAGFGDWPKALAEAIHAYGGSVLTETNVKSFELGDGRVRSVRTEIHGQPQQFDCDYLVSSVPLPLLGKLIFGSGDAELNLALQGLQFRHLILVYIFLNRPWVLEDQWIFFPQQNVVFSRLFEQKQMNPELGPPGRTVLTADFTASEGSKLWNTPDNDLAQRVIDGLVQTDFVTPDEVQHTLVLRRKNFYPRYDLEYAEKMQLISNKLRRIPNLLTTGRIGMYNYNNSDHCADMGRFIAEHLAAGSPPTQIWIDLERRVADYKIID